MDDVAHELIKLSVLGPVVVGMGISLWKMHKELNHVYEQRTLDAQAVTQKLLDVSEKWNTSINNLDATLESQKDALLELKEVVRDLAR